MRKNKKRILITGVSGLLGNNLAYYFRDDYIVLGFYSKHPVVIDGVETREANILSGKIFKRSIEEICPDVVIHCASLTDVDFCENNRDLTKQVNVVGSRLVAQSLKNTKAKLIYISTDSVYDGNKGNFKETDKVKPQNYYGFTKYQGEREVLKLPGSLVLRTNIFGWNIQDKTSIAEWIIRRLLKNKQVNGFEDTYFSSIYTFEFARIMKLALEEDLKEVYNCASRTSLSKYEFALELARQFDMDVSLVNPISIDDFGFRAKRGKNLTLNVDKLSKDLKYQLPTISNSIVRFYQDFKAGLPVKIRPKRKVICQTGRSNFIPYGRHSIDEDDIEAVVKVLKSDRITQGPKIQEFEKALCLYTGAKYAVVVSSGTAALHIACLAAGLKEKDEFITSPNTFVASANCGVYCGARPVFADIREDTYNIDPEEIKEKITPKTKAVIPVHFAGQICDMGKIKSIIQAKQAEYKEKIFIIEDASHALGSVYKGSKAGSCIYSDMTVMSFHPVKHITTGEGGVVFTNDDRLYKKLKLLRSHGITNNEDELVYKKQAYGPSGINPWYYEQQALGFNYRITDIQCALGISQLKKIDYCLRRRRKIFGVYNKAFADNKFITLPFESPECFTNWHLYVLQIDFDKLGEDRADIIRRLKDKGIGTQVHYIPVHTQPFYRKHFGTNWKDCPRAEAYYQRCLSIPIFPAMMDKDVDTVISAMRDLEKR